MGTLFWAMQRAFTLPELVLVLAVLGIILGISLPQLSAAADRIEVQSAAQHLIAAHQRARILAMAKGQVLTLSVDSAMLSISSPAGAPLLWSEPGPVRSGVSLDGPTRRFTFAPEGYNLGLSNASFHLIRGSATRTVVFSRLGRVRVLR
jgi:prepilin-type N-terminal cleavage/methylation domain-containing protein